MLIKRVESEFKKTPITISFIAINVLVYIFTSFKYSASMNGYQGYLAGGFCPELLEYFPEYYRIVTANFIHFGVIHLLCNMISLWNLGRFIELNYQKLNYFILIIASAISTTLLPYIYYLIVPTSSGTYVSGGFSGVIFGFIGGICALAYVYRDLYSRILKSMALNLLLMVYLSISIANISFSGHFAGFVGGFICTMFLIRFRPSIHWKHPYDYH